jgi:hypothetical protein
MYALTVSPRYPSGTPTTAASRTAGCVYSTSSTSRGHTLKPDALIMSFFRSTTYSHPSASMNPMSPVRSSPPGKVSAVASGRRQYPGTTCGPRTRISPCSPNGTSAPRSSTIRTTVSGPGTPTASVPDAGSTGASRPGGTEAQGAVHSVRPYPLRMYGPKPARNFSTSAGGSGAPPEEMIRNEEKWSGVTSGWAASAMKAVDGPTV